MCVCVCVCVHVCVLCITSWMNVFLCCMCRINIMYNYHIFQVSQENQSTVIVMEDDVNFHSFFDGGLYNVLREANKYTPSWDFM